MESKLQFQFLPTLPIAITKLHKDKFEKVYNIYISFSIWTLEIKNALKKEFLVCSLITMSVLFD